MLQELPKYEELVETDTAPLLRETGRPQNNPSRPSAVRPNAAGSTPTTPADNSGLLK